MKRFLSLLLAVIMCVSMVPMTLIDALAHGRGVAGNNIENQSLINMSQLLEQVNVDGKTDDTAWDDLKWNVADSSTGTWDVKDPLNNDYAFKYQLRRDGEYFYGVIVLAKKDATVKVLINDGTNDNAGYTDYLQFDVKADGTLTAQHSFADAEGTLPAEAYKHASAINGQGRIVIEFKTLIKSFSESVDLTCFVSSTVEGVLGTETLYYPRVPYSAGGHDVPTQTHWPENSIKVELADIRNDDRNNDSHVLPSPIDVDGNFKEAMWVEFSNYYDYGSAERNQIIFKNGDPSDPQTGKFAYQPASLYGLYSKYHYINNNYTSDTSGGLKFKYSYRYDENNLYLSAVVYDADPGSTPYLYLFTHFGSYAKLGSTYGPTSDANDTFVIHNTGAWHYAGESHTAVPVSSTDIPSGFQSHVSYLDASIYAYEMKIPMSEIRNETYGKEVSYILRVYDPDGTGQYAIAANGGFGGTFAYHQYGASMEFVGIANNKEYGDNNRGGYWSEGLNETHFINLIASDSKVNPGLRGGYGTSGNAGKGEQIVAEMNVDYDYLYGAVMVNTESFWPTEVGYRQKNPDGGWGDMIRIYIKNGHITTTDPLASADGYLSFYLQKDASGNYNARAAWTNMKTGEEIKDVLSVDASMKQLSQTDGSGHFVPLEFRIPLSVIGATVSTLEDASGTILSWYASVESQGDGGAKGLVYPRPADYAYFYRDTNPTVEGGDIGDKLKEGVFYPYYWHARFDKEVTYSANLVDTVVIDGKLEEPFWDNLDDMITVSQENGVWDKEPKGNSAFTYNYKIYNTPDHIYGAAIVEFPIITGTTKFKFWTKREGANPRCVTIYVDGDGTAHAHVEVNGSETHVDNSDSIRVMATTINGKSVIEFSLKNDRENLGEYEYAVGVTHLGVDHEELTLFHLGDKDGWTPLWLTGYNTNSLSSNGGGVIYSKSDFETAYKNSDWWDYYLFAPAEGYSEGVFKVIGSSLGVNHGTGTGSSVAKLFADAGVSAIPEGGFVYCLHTGNKYSIDYTSSNSYNGYINYRNDFAKGAVVQFEDIDTKNFKTVSKLSDDGIEYYENGYYATSRYKIVSATTASEIDTLGNANLPSATVWSKNAEKVQRLGFFNRELITVDGDLGDSGWDAERWINVNRLVNASYQSNDYRGADDADFKYQMRTDGKYVYIAAVIKTDIEGQITGPSNGDETITKLTDLPSFRIWIKGDDEDDANKDGITGDSLTFTHLYDLAINTSQQTITNVKTTYYTGESFADGFTETAPHNSEHYTYDASADTLKPHSVGMSVSSDSYASQYLYPTLRFAKTNDNGWQWPAGGNNFKMFQNGELGAFSTVDNFYEYGKSSLFGHTEKIEENTVSGLAEKNEWYSKPNTVQTTFGNEHGTIKYDSDLGATVVEFKIGLDEIDKDGNGFEYYVHVANTGYGAANPYTIFYPTIQHEVMSNNIYMMYSLPYWMWYTENSYKVDADEYAYMMLRDSYGPVSTLGAKIIQDYNGDGTDVKAIRFGAYYNEDFIRWPANVKNASDKPSSGLDADLDGVLNYWDIAEVGMLIAPTQLLPDNTGLTHETDVKYLDAVADPITNWVEGSNLADYDTMVFHVPVKNIPTSMKFTFVPYVDYYANNGTETYYGIPAERSYDYVLNALGGNAAANASPFWITHINDTTSYVNRTGSGRVFTKDYTYDRDGKQQYLTYWTHIAFAPTHVDGVYKIVEIADGADGSPTEGSGRVLAIPEGGFVWTAHNDEDNPTASAAAIELSRNWVVGDTIAFYGWTPGTGVPTSTPSLSYKDPNYICSVTVEQVVILPDPDESEDESSEESIEESIEESSEAEESSEPEETYDENVIVYIPIDDRPVNYDRELYQAEAAGFTILTPDHEDLKTYLNYADVPKTVNISFYNAQLWREETSAIYTKDYSGVSNSIYNINVAFTPTGTSGVYTITQIADHAVNGSSNPRSITVPAGGFVYVANTGSYEGVKIAQEWKVGDLVKVEGLSGASGATVNTAKSMTFTVVNDESRIGNRENIINWLEDIYTNGATVNGQTVKPKYYVLSTDMLLSGGLVGSRAFAYLDEYDPNYTLENRALDLVKTIAQDDKTYVVAFDTIMRLATTGNFLDHSLAVYNITRVLGGYERYQLSGSALTLENIKKYWRTAPDGSTIDYTQAVYGATMNQAQIDDYFASRERKLILAEKIINELGQYLDYLYLGTDDSKPQETVQSNERRYIERLVDLAGIGSKTAVMAATDELGILGISMVSVDKNADGNKIPVNLHFIDGDPYIAYEQNPSDDYDIGNYEQTLLSHIISAGAELRTEQNNSYLQILVVPRTTSAHDWNIDTNAEIAAQNKAVTECLDKLKYNLANNIPTVLINAIGGNGQNLYFLNGVASDGTKFMDMDLMKLYGFSQWNTVANATGIALGNGISRYAYLKSDATVTDKSNVAFIKAMATSYAKDIAYIANGRDQAYNYYYDIRNQIEDKIENAPYYVDLGVIGTTPSTIVIGDYERLENWDHRDFEAQIPVLVNPHNDAYNANYTDVILNRRDPNRGTQDSEYGYNQYSGKLTDGLVYTNVNSDYMDKWYAFRTNYDDVGIHQTSGSNPNDGKIGTGDSVWLNTDISIGMVDIDLGSVRNLDLVRVFYCDVSSDAGKKVLAPESIKVLVSNDKSNWTEVGEIKDYSEQGLAATPFYENGSYWVTGSLDEGTSGRYVRVEICVPYVQGIHSWIGEIQVWNEPEA